MGAKCDLGVFGVFPARIDLAFRQGSKRVFLFLFMNRNTRFSHRGLTVKPTTTVRYAGISIHSMSNAQSQVAGGAPPSCDGLVDDK